jgi:hypothetical protein
MYGEEDEVFSDEEMDVGEEDHYALDYGSEEEGIAENAEVDDEVDDEIEGVDADGKSQNPESLHRTSLFTAAGLYCMITTSPSSMYTR